MKPPAPPAGPPRPGRAQPGRPGAKPIRWFRAIRIAVLLLVLLAVAATTWQDRYRSTRWREPLLVAIYPIVADSSPVTRNYVDSLDDERFKAIDRFFDREAERYGLGTTVPFRTRRQAELVRHPPEQDAAGGLFGTVLWSLRLRYWAWTVSRGAREPADVYPQANAEIMAARRMLSPTRWQQASSLDEVVIGTATAAEIRWPAHLR